MATLTVDFLRGDPRVGSTHSDRASRAPTRPLLRAVFRRALGSRAFWTGFGSISMFVGPASQRLRTYHASVAQALAADGAAIAGDFQRAGRILNLEGYQGDVVTTNEPTNRRQFELFPSRG